jgi:hypothetical protein
MGKRYEQVDHPSTPESPHFSTLATVISTVRPARSGMSSTNTGPPFRGTGADFRQRHVYC